MTIGKEQNLGKRYWTAKDYVQDGLIIMVDCLENAGFGKHVDGTTLVNLATESAYGPKDVFEVDENRMTVSNSYSGTLYFQYQPVHNAMKSGKFTYETVQHGYSVAFGLPNYSTNGWSHLELNMSSYNMQTRLGLVLKYKNQSNPIKTYRISAAADQTTGTVIIDGVRFDFTEQDGLTWPTIDPYGLYHYKNAMCKSMRWYNRCLSEEELEHNALVDKMRFKL